MRTIRPVIALVSPRDYTDIDRVCRTARNLCATCAGCGEVIVSGAHMPFIAHGFFHPACCPCASFVPTAEEVAAMEANAAGAAVALAPNPEERRGGRPRKEEGAPTATRRTRVRYRDNDLVTRRGAVTVRFGPSSQYGILWDLIPDAGLTFEHLVRLSPWSEETTWHVLRRMDRVKKVIAVRRAMG